MAAGKSLQELGLKDEALPEQDLNDLPEFGGFQPPPPPGTYRFRVPNPVGNAFDLADTDKGQRITVIFGADNPLVITQATRPALINTPFQTRLSGKERKRGKDGPEVSDLDYLDKAMGQTTRSKSNREVAQRVLGYGSKEFAADLTYSWACSEKRDIYVKDAAGATVKVEGTKGCGAKYYQDRDVKKDETTGEYPYEITCSCGALVRAFANLDRIRA